ncbi:MAG: GNAT family N-acetyltransferase [Clostridia bacterium]|nr:GNAT family N-acetyltransferase [Clostridia bacterium]
MERFTVRFAKTQEEKNAVYALRYRDMILEFRPEMQFVDGMDITPYDEYAKQIICIDNETGEVVGCYRIITSDSIPEGKGFVSEEEFSFETLKATGEPIAELSRACVKREYRNTAVLMLLLRFIVLYIRENGYRFIIGEASFGGTDKGKYLRELSYLTHFHAVDESYGIRSLEEEQIQTLAKEELCVTDIKRELPPLIRAYLSFGAKTSAQSFTDRDFGSVDVFVLLDIQNYNEAYINRLLRIL